MITVLLTIGIIAVFFVLMSVRLLFLKNGEFKGTCASQSTFLRYQGITCGCSKGECENQIKEESEVDKLMTRFG